MLIDTSYKVRFDWYCYDANVSWNLVLTLLGVILNFCLTILWIINDKLLGRYSLILWLDFHVAVACLSCSQPAGCYRPTAYGPTDRPCLRSLQQKSRPICTHF